jgi:hypothetical protein
MELLHKPENTVNYWISIGRLFYVLGLVIYIDVMAEPKKSLP